MATAWPEHEFLTLTKKPALYIDGRKLLTNTQKTQDGILKSYMYCQNKPSCKASAIAIFLEGIIINIINTLSQLRSRASYWEAQSTMV